MAIDIQRLRRKDTQHRRVCLGCLGFAECVAVDDAGRQRDEQLKLLTVPSCGVPLLAGRLLGFGKHARRPFGVIGIDCIMHSTSIRGKIALGIWPTLRRHGLNRQKNRGIMVARSGIKRLKQGRASKVIFDEPEKPGVNMTVRAPESLLDRIREISKKERVSQNQIKVNLLTAGADAFEWAFQNWEQIRRIRREKEDFADLLVRLAKLGLETALKQQRPEK